MSHKKHPIAVRVLATAALGVTATLALPATAAQATIGTCQHGPTSGYVGWQAHHCDSTDPGRDRFRAIAYCIREGGSRQTAYGPWMSVINNTSVATCPVNFSAYSGGYGTKTI